MDKEFFALVVVAVSVLGFPSLFAIATTAPEFRTKSLLFFRNRAAALGVTVFISLSAIEILAIAAVTLDNCSGSITSSSSCEHMPETLGGLLTFFSLAGIYYFLFVGFPFLIILVASEYVSRRRQNKAKPNA